MMQKLSMYSIFFKNFFNVGFFLTEIQWRSLDKEMVSLLYDFLYIYIYKKSYRRETNIYIYIYIYIWGGRNCLKMLIHIINKKIIILLQVFVGVLLNCFSEKILIYTSNTKIISLPFVFVCAFFKEEFYENANPQTL